MPFLPGELGAKKHKKHKKHKRHKKHKKHKTRDDSPASAQDPDQEQQPLEGSGRSHRKERNYRRNPAVDIEPDHTNSRGYHERSRSRSRGRSRSRSMSRGWSPPHPAPGAEAAPRVRGRGAPKFGVDGGQAAAAGAWQGPPPWQRGRSMSRWVLFVFPCMGLPCMRRFSVSNLLVC